jgi:pimeloyl-ACP methyl ester carboxylesterase
MAAKSFSYNGQTISYTDVGNGKIVVLLHGFAETSNVWKAQIQFLEDDYRIVAPEIPDVIASSTLSNSIDSMADAVAALIQSITKEPVILLGHSMGGYITLAVAEKYPQLLKAFGLVHSTAFADTDEKRETRRKAIDFIQKNGTEAFLKTSAPGLFSDNSKTTHPEWVNEAVQMGSVFKPETLTANYEAMMARPDRTNVLQGSKLPVLFIIGIEDKAAPADDLMKQVHLPQVSYFHLLDNVGHMGMWEAADEVNTFIQKFIEDCG